jgi:hypothetical protein
LKRHRYRKRHHHYRRSYHRNLFGFGKLLVAGFLLVVIVSALVLFGVGSSTIPIPYPTPTPSTTPYPTVTPTSAPPPGGGGGSTPTPTPAPTPQPTTPPNGNNLAPINDGKWHSDYSWNSPPADNIYFETNPVNMHNGALTFRVEAGGPSLAVDHAWGSLAVKPGDHIVMSCWVKTSGTPDSVLGRSGATVGMDMYTGSYNGDWARIGACNSPGFVAIKGNWGAGWPSDGATWMVPWGSNWVLRTYDFIVPNLWWGDGGLSSHQVARGTYVAPQFICPWLQISANYGSTQGTYTTWFSDFQLYINP